MFVYIMLVIAEPYEMVQHFITTLHVMLQMHDIYYVLLLCFPLCAFRLHVVVYAYSMI